jgi:hypothetical protein
MTARFGYYPPRPIRSLKLTPEAELAIQDSAEFKALLEEYYKKYPYMEGDKYGGVSSIYSDSGDCDLVFGGKPGAAPVDLEEEAARVQDDRDDHIDGKPF